ncbi:hypothetical protein [Roseobacter phage RDJL6]|nr:hypothetical protein [Roseobacter phage RDJL6]
MTRLTRLTVASRRANRFFAGRDEMLCARAYRRKWWAFIIVVDVLFVVIRWRLHRHCEEMYRWERRYGHEVRTPSLNWKKFIEGVYKPHV